MAVDWGGRSCNYAALRNAGKWGESNFNPSVPIIEDAAHRLYVGQNTEHRGDYVAWSFGPIKHLTTGGYGGALLVPDWQFERARLLRWHGLDRLSSEDFRCIHKQTKVRMANGRAIQISKVVADKNPGPVLVYENGQLVPRRVIGWHENPRTGRKFLRIALKSLEGREAAIVTEDHEVLTRQGWKRADQLTAQDEVATAYPSPSALQRQLLIGGLLGDAGINGMRGGRRRNVIVETHTARDRTYAEAKVSALAGLGMQMVERPPDPKHPNGSVQFWSKSLPTLSELGQAFYPNGHKHVPRELIEREGLSDAALAIWFMDDGHTTIHNGMDALHPYCQVASNGFTEEDVRWLVDYLEGIDLPSRATSSAGSTGWRIAFTKEGSRRLIERIARFVPQHMRYKVAHLPELEPFDPESWGTGESLVSWDEVIVTELPARGHSGRKVRSDNMTYCLTVEGESHNFVAGPIVVHNCAQDIEESGYRYHMTDDQAVVGLANFDLAQRGVAAARANAAWYSQALSSVRGITLPQYLPTADYWIFTLLADRRDELKAYLASKNIASSQVHARNDKHTAFKRAAVRQDGGLLGVEQFDAHQLSIPCGWWVSPAEREQIASAIIEWASVPASV